MRNISILICGNYGAFNLKLISRFAKEKEEIFVITGKKTGDIEKNKDVFQEYTFAYENEGIVNIINNVHPNTVIFLGALDEYYPWYDEQKQAVEYISGLANVVTAAKMANVPKFIYCSTMAVFQDNEENVIEESTLPKPNSYRHKAYLQGEDICRHYDNDENFSVSIVRFPEVYGSFAKKNVRDNICTDILTQAMEEKSVDIFAKKSHMLLYLDDAVEILYKLHAQINAKQMLFQIVSDCYCEEEIAVKVQELLIKKEIEVREQDLTETPIRKQYISKCMETHSFYIKYTLEQGLQKLCLTTKEMVRKEKGKQRIKRVFLDNTLIPFIESIVLFALIFFAQSFIAESKFLRSADLYLLYVVLISAVYGSVLGMIAVALSVVGNVGFLIRQGGIESILSNYDAYVWVIQILIISVLVSYVRDKYKRKLEDVTDEKNYYEDELTNLKKINDSNVYVKDMYEKRLVNYKNSLAKIFEITSQLDFLESQKVIFQAVYVIKQVMEVEHVAIYTASAKSKYCRLAAASTIEARKLGKSLCYDQELPYYYALAQKEIYRNREMDENCPTLAGATYNDTRLETIVVIWSNSLEKTSLYETNLLAILCRLIEKSMSRALTYMDSIHGSSYVGDSRVMKEKPFKKIIDLYRDGSKQEMLDYTLISVSSKDNTGTELYEACQKMVRDTDYLGIGEEHKIFVLLTNSNITDSQFVINRFIGNNFEVEVLN